MKGRRNNISTSRVSQSVLIQRIKTLSGGYFVGGISGQVGCALLSRIRYCSSLFPLSYFGVILQMAIRLSIKEIAFGNIFVHFNM